jgi:hypothetical protein
MAELRESLETDLRFKKRNPVIYEYERKPLLELSDEDWISDSAFWWI